MLGLGAGAQTNIKAVITAEDKASSVLKGFGDSVGSLGGVVEKGLKLAAVGLAAGAAAATAFGVVSVKAFSESEDMIAQTNAVLKSTGGVAGVTAAEVTKLAKSLQTSTKFSDEQVRSAENLLLTFTSIGKDIFPQATKTVLDMSTALGEDTKSASIQLGKALQDPILGVTALRRVGVNFSQSQQDVIKKLVETGQKAKAQQLILKELNTEFGGSAEAAGGTFAGALAKLKNQFNDIQETVGQVIVNALTPLVGKLAEVLSKIDWQAAINNTLTFLRLLWDAISGGDPTLKKGEERFVGIAKVMAQVSEASRALQSFGTTMLHALKQAWDFLQPSVEAFWNTLKTNLIPTLERLWKEVIVPLAPVVGVILVAALWIAINALNVFEKAAFFVINVLISIVNFVVVTLPAAIAAGFNFVVEKLTWLKNNFWVAIGEVIGFVATLPIKLPLLMAQAIGGIIGAVLSVNWGGVFSGIWHGMVWVFDRIKDTVMSTFHFIANVNWGSAVSGIAKSLANALIGLIEGALKGALKGLPGNVENSIHLPRFASGVKNFGGGLAVVGEQGAEIVNLPSGSDVIPHNRISQASGGGGVVNVVVNVGLYAGSEQEKRKVALELLKSLQDIAGAKSTTVADMLGA